MLKTHIVQLKYHPSRACLWYLTILMKILQSLHLLTSQIHQSGNRTWSTLEQRSRTISMVYNIHFYLLPVLPDIAQIYLH